jgi:hypothetical protein
MKKSVNLPVKLTDEQLEQAAILLAMKANPSGFVGTFYQEPEEVKQVFRDMVTMIHQIFTEMFTEEPFNEET